MKTISCVFMTAAQNFRKWSGDKRMWLIAVLLLILCFDFMRSVVTVSHAYDMKSSIWAFPFIYSQFYMKLIFTLPVILIFCNAPYVDRNYLLIMTRTGSRNYLAGQILYIVMAGFIYYAYIFLIVTAMAIPFSEFSGDWGAFYTFAYSAR